MADLFSKGSDTGLVGNIGKSIVASIFGFIMFICAFPLELWNESRAINQEIALHEGEKKVMSVDAATLNPSNNGKLIYVNGEATTKSEVQDTEFGIKVNALKLKRNVSMFQWEESRESTEEKKVGGGTHTETTYSYSKEWKDRLIDSRSFEEPSGHANPQSFKFESLEDMAHDVTLGAFKLTDDIVNKLPSKDYAIPADAKVYSIPAAKREKIVVEDAHFYAGNPNEPQVGDERISYKYTPKMTCSIVAQQQDQMLAPYTTSNGNKIELVQAGTLSPAEMFKKAEDENTTLTWVLRCVGVFLMFFGLRLMGAPLTAITSILPFMGDMVGFGLGIFSFGLALTLSFVTIAIGWIAFRPMVSLSLLGASVVVLFLIFRLGPKKDRG